MTRSELDAIKSRITATRDAKTAAESRVAAVREKVQAIADNPLFSLLGSWERTKINEILEALG